MSRHRHRKSRRGAPTSLSFPEPWEDEVTRAKPSQVDVSVNESSRRVQGQFLTLPSELELDRASLRYETHEGSLEKLSFPGKKWQRRWFVLKDGVLTYYSDREEARRQTARECDGAHLISTTKYRLHSIPFRTVQAIIRTENDEEIYGKCCFSIRSSTRKLTLRASSTYDMQGWLLKLHNTLATMFTSMVESRGAFNAGSFPLGNSLLRRKTDVYEGDESLFIPTEEIINSIQNSQSDYQSPDSCTLYNRIRRASCSSNDDELRRRESPSGSGKRSTFTSSSYDSPGSLPSHYSGSYRGSSRAGSISRDESSLEVFEVDGVCQRGGGVEERRQIRQNKFSQEQQQLVGDGNDVAKATSQANPFKSSIPSQRPHGCCGKFGGDLERGGLWWTCGCFSIVGRREKQEDRYCVIPRYDELIENGEGSSEREWKRAGFFGIYDGHCGAEAAQFVADELHTRLAHKVRIGMEPKMAVTETFLELDSQFLDIAEENDLYCGSTVILVLLMGKRLLVGGIGDCEAILCKNRSPKVLFETHRPDRADELLRIESAGGWVTTERELSTTTIRNMDLSDPQIRQSVPDHFNWNIISRLCGELSVSRSIGDRDFKGFGPSNIKDKNAKPCVGKHPVDDSLFNWPMGHKHIFYDNLVIADPEVKLVDVEDDDNFVIIACDGFWDVLKIEEAVNYAHDLLDEGKCAQYVSQKLCELALRMGSSDNVTVVVVTLNSTPA